MKSKNSVATTRAEIDADGTQYVTVLFQDVDTGERHCVRFVPALALCFADHVVDAAHAAEKLVRRGRV